MHTQYQQYRSGKQLLCFLLVFVSAFIYQTPALSETFTGPGGNSISYTISGAENLSYTDGYSDIEGEYKRNYIGNLQNTELLTISGSATACGGIAVGSGDYAWSSGSYGGLRYFNDEDADWTFEEDRGSPGCFTIPFNLNLPVKNDTAIEFYIDAGGAWGDPQDYDYKGIAIYGLMDAPPVPSTCTIGKGGVCPFGVSVATSPPYSVGSEIQFSFSRTLPLAGCFGEQNTYWNFGDGTTSAGLDNISPEPHVYEYSGDFRVMAVYQITTSPTEKYECYTEDKYIKVVDSIYGDISPASWSYPYISAIKDAGITGLIPTHT